MLPRSCWGDFYWDDGEQLQLQLGSWDHPQMRQILSITRSPIIVWQGLGSNRQLKPPGQSAKMHKAKDIAHNGLDAGGAIDTEYDIFITIVVTQLLCKSFTDSGLLPSDESRTVCALLVAATWYSPVRARLEVQLPRPI